ncbi:MAG: citrate synthase [Flavobacteriales bacterium]|nr:citrate synthase [Flavobacteriales bacterium]
MSSNVKISYNNSEVELPIVKSVYGADAVDISTLKAQTGLITLDVGFKNTGSTKSRITYLDGAEGKLLYRGYPIEQLSEKSTFTEVMYLLLHGELPTLNQLEKFERDIMEHCYVSQEMEQILQNFPRSAHPMGVLSSLTSALTAFNPRIVDVKSPEDMYEATLMMLGKFMVLCTWTYRKKFGLPINYSNPKLDYVSNFHQMMFRKPFEEYKVDPVVIDSLNKLFILHADHEQNCSTSAVRITGSSHAGLFASISAGVSALWGPLHGGANQAVIEMLEMIKHDGGDLQKWVDKAKDKSDDFRLMGFGHRVYKNFDPRAKIIKKACDGILEKLGVEDEVLEIAKGLEKVALEDPYFVERKLYPNVDFYSGIIYRALGIPTEMFTVMFALGRLPGWISQWKEMRDNNEPIGRPMQVYIGAERRDYVPMNER